MLIMYKKRLQTVLQHPKEGYHELSFQTGRGIGLVAGAAVAAVKLIEKVWPQDDALDDVVYTVETGEFPQEDGTDAEDAPEAPYRPFDPDAALAPVPNVNPVEAPPAVPVTDPTKIADPADFQDWDELGCQG